MAGRLLVSWNVNGIRAAVKKGYLEFLAKADPDVVCVQETKAWPDQLGPEILEPAGYKTYWACAEKKGYSGTAIFSKEAPRSVEPLGVADYDAEGRVQIADMGDYHLVNCYFPNSQEAGKRLDYKLGFCAAVKDRCEALRAEGKHVVLCGDYNIAHKAIDLKNPKRNEKNPGYLPEERAWMDVFTEAGWLDTFRMFNQDPDQYSWWSYRFQARAKNIGWRIDYHCVNPEFGDKVLNAEIWKDVLGSDHCPVTVEINV